MTRPLTLIAALVATAPLQAHPAPTPASERSPAAAKRVVDTYLAALSAKRYGTAYNLWGGNGAASGTSQARFAKSFAKYRIFHGRAGRPGPVEGAAGSSFIEFPVTATGRLVHGSRFHLSGLLTLRRVNDVDGSTAEQRRWHIASSDLKPRP